MFGKDWYSTDLFTEWGLKFMDEARAENKPFFLYIAQGPCISRCGAPEPSRSIAARYWKAGTNSAASVTPSRSRWGWSTRDGPWPRDRRKCPTWESRPTTGGERFDQIMAVYAAMIDRIDLAMGTLVDGLERRGVLDEHADPVPSDNGGNAEGGPPGDTRGDGRSAGRNPT